MRTRPIDESALAPSAVASVDGPISRPRPRQTFLQVLEEGASNPGDRAGAVGSPRTSASGRPAGGELRTMLARTLRTEDRLDRLIAAGAAGKTFTAGQLLALQASAFRYAQTIEVLSRSADRLVGSIKQTLGTQV